MAKRDPVEIAEDITAALIEADDWAEMLPRDNGQVKELRDLLRRARHVSQALEEALDD